MKSILWICVFPIALLVAEVALTASKSSKEDECLTPHLMIGQSYSNVFSIGHAVNAEGYDEYVRRNGSSAD